MGDELGWSKDRRAKETQEGKAYLLTMGLEDFESQAEFNAMELVKYRQEFDALDANGDGHVSVDDLDVFMSRVGPKLPADQLKVYVDEIDTNKNGMIEFNEFLELMLAIKHGNKKMKLASLYGQEKLNKISTTRSGGGV